MKLDDIDSRNHTAEEVLDLLIKMQNPKHSMLITWISRAIAYQKLNQVVRVAIADSEREVEKLRRGET